MWERRGVIVKPELVCSFNQADCETLIPRLAMAVELKLSTMEFSRYSSPVVSENGLLHLYNVQGEPDADNQIFVHSLIPEKNTDDIAEDFCADFWKSVAAQGIKNVIAFADAPERPKYMPPEGNAKFQLTSLPLNKGDSRSFKNGYQVKVISIEQLNDIQSIVAGRPVTPKPFSEQEPAVEQETIIARAVTLELTPPKSNNSADSRETFQVTVDQIFCWSEHVRLEHEISERIVSRFGSENTQVHCEGGTNRSPAAVLMYQLSAKSGLTEANVLDKIAEGVHDIRCKCHNRNAINRPTIETIISFVLKNSNINMDNIRVEVEPVTAPSTSSSSIWTFDVEESAVTKVTVNG